MATDDAVSGFTQPEKELYAYERHLFLYYKNPASWPPSFEASDTDPLPKLFISTWKARRNDMTIKTKISICEERKDIRLFEGDVMVLPDRIKYRGLDESNVEEFFEDVLVNGKPWLGGLYGVIPRSLVYISAHGNPRDVERANLLINKFNDLIPSDDKKNHKIYVTACSHVDCWYKYPGNVVIYSPSSVDYEIMANWYENVSPNDVPLLLDHIAKRQPLLELWWGQMDPSAAQVERADAQRNYEDAVRKYGPNGADDHKLSNGEVTYKGKNNHIDILTTIGMLGSVAAVVAVVYISYRRYCRNTTATG